MKFWELKIQNFIVFGDTAYLNLRDIDIAFVKFLRNQNLVFNDFENFKKEVMFLNPEIQDITFKNESLEIITINVKNKDLCCVVVDNNENKFLVQKDGKVIKKLNFRRSYPLEVPIDQAFTLDVKLDIAMIEKINEIEKLFSSNNQNISDIRILNESFEITTTENKILLLNLETSLSEFWEKYQTMIAYLSENNKAYQSIDFRFDKVVVK